jgi:hypothetical protein
LAPLHQESNTFNVPASGADNSGTVSGPAGLNVDGGGVQLGDPAHQTVTGTYPGRDRKSWVAYVFGSASQTVNNDTVCAICAAAATTTPELMLSRRAARRVPRGPRRQGWTRPELGRAPGPATGSGSSSAARYRGIR